MEGMVPAGTDPLAGYFDYNASTPVHPLVVETLLEELEAHPASPAAAYPAGRAAAQVIARARETIASAIGARPGGIRFTSGGTESNNWALLGVTRAHERACAADGSAPRRHLVVSAIEHKSVLETARELEREGWQVTRVAPRVSGAVHLRDVQAALREETLLVSVMWANNETGVVQPVREIASLCRKRGILFHTDAVAVLGKLPVDVGEVECDLLSLSSHKLYAPKGVGVLYVRAGVAVAPLIHGCGQQDGLRSGTENTPGVAALARAVGLIAEGACEPREQALEVLRQHLWFGIAERFPGAERNGEGGLLPNTLNVAFPGCDAVELQTALGRRGYSVATGSAGSGGAASHVLLAMGASPERARSSLRFSLGAGTTLEGIEALLSDLEQCARAAATGARIEVSG